MTFLQSMQRFWSGLYHAAPAKSNKMCTHCNRKKMYCACNSRFPQCSCRRPCNHPLRCASTLAAMPLDDDDLDTALQLEHSESIRRSVRARNMVRLQKDLVRRNREKEHLNDYPHNPYHVGSQRHGLVRNHETPCALDGHYESYRNYDFASTGSTYAHYPVSDDAECQIDCSNDRDCYGFSSNGLDCRKVYKPTRLLRAHPGARTVAKIKKVC